MNIKLSELSTDDLINLYPSLLNELKKREIIRTKNIIGELGEYLAKEYYDRNPKLPMLQLGIKSTKNIDAISTISGNMTGVFQSIPIEDDGKVYFEYLIVVMFDKDYQLKSIYELSWDIFLKYRKIKKPENKYHIFMSKEVIGEAKKIL